MDQDNGPTALKVCVIIKRNNRFIILNYDDLYVSLLIFVSLEIIRDIQLMKISLGVEKYFFCIAFLIKMSLDKVIGIVHLPLLYNYKFQNTKRIEILF